MFKKLRADIRAAKANDPAARSKFEIWLTYSGVHALSWHRFARFLYRIHLRLLARMVSQTAKFFTGIEIHPAAKIAGGVFIDHGTGVVIGETAEIGDDCTIYQGVTLGALSTRGGQSLRGVRRHPTIEDNVTIYAGASILGGETVIGRGCVIGSNAFITRSIAPGTTVSIKNQELQFKTRVTPEQLTIISKDPE